MVLDAMAARSGHAARSAMWRWPVTGEMIRELLEPVIGQSGSISLVIKRAGHIGFVTAENKKLTGVEVRPDGLVRLDRETGWVVIDPEGVVAVVWDSELEPSAGQFL